jgi:hypothetical protein
VSSDYVSVVVFGADGSKRLVRGPSSMVAPIVQQVSQQTSVDAFVTQNTNANIEQTGTILDPAIPSTPQQYESNFGNHRYEYTNEL